LYDCYGFKTLPKSKQIKSATKIIQAQNPKGYEDDKQQILLLMPSAD